MIQRFRILSRPSTFLVLVAAAATFSACGKGEMSVHQVAGQVLVDGAPAEFATVVFHPVNADEELNAFRPAARTDAEGRFKLTTYREGDGAPAGEYQVTVDWPGPDPDLPPAEVVLDDEAATSGPDRLKGRYADPQTSGLAASVKPGVNQFPPFEISMKGDPGGSR